MTAILGFSYVIFWIILEISLSHGRQPGQGRANQNHHHFYSFLFFPNLKTQLTDYLSCRISLVTIFINHLYLSNFSCGVCLRGSKDAQKLILQPSDLEQLGCSGPDSSSSKQSYLFTPVDKEILSASSCAQSWKGLRSTELYCKF